MKVEISEGEGLFHVQLTPETPQDINQLVRLSKGSRRKTLTSEVIFYKDGTTLGYISSRKHRRKDFGTIK